MKIFNVPKAPYTDDENIYKTSTFKFQPGVTILVGCNGCGKTTLLQHIKSTLEQEDVLLMHFNNLTNGGSNAISEAAFRNNFELAATLMASSEGESIICNIATVTRKIGALINKNAINNKPLFLLFDAIDSGLSVDNVVDVKKYLFDAVLKDNAEQREVYIICSANEYELCNGEQCMDVYTGKYREFKTYNSFRKFILKSRELKDKRYK